MTGIKQSIEERIDRLQTGAPIDGPSGWELSRKGQQIVDAAVLSVASGETVMIDPGEGNR